MRCQKSEFKMKFSIFRAWFGVLFCVLVTLRLNPALMGTIMSLDYISFFKLRIQKDVDDDVM